MLLAGMAPETSTKRQRSDLFGFQVKLPPVTTSQRQSR